MRFWKSISETIHRDVTLEELVDPHLAMARARRTWLLFRETIRSILRHQSLTVASALAFKTLTALVPVLMISLIIVGSLPTGSGDTKMSDFFITVVEGQIPDAPQLAPPLKNLIKTVANHATEIQIIGFFLLFITVYSLLFSIETSFNMIWQVKTSRPIFNRIIAYLATVILVPVLLTLSVLITSNFREHLGDWFENMQQKTSDMVSGLDDTLNNPSQLLTGKPSETPPVAAEAKTASTPSNPALDEATPAPSSATPEADTIPESGAAIVETGLASSEAATPLPTESGKPTTTARVAKKENKQGAVVSAVLFISSLLTTVLALGAMYFLMPYTRVKWQSALAGGVFAGVLIECLKIGFRYYAASAATNLTAVYGGTLLAVPLGLLWLWLIWVIILIGAEIAFTLQNFTDLATRAELERRGLSSRVYFAVRIVLLASEYFHRGQSPDELIDRLAKTLRLPPYAISEIVELLLKKDILRQVTKKEDAYVPAKDIGVLSVGEVVRAINEDPLDVPEQPDDNLRQYLGKIFAETEAAASARLDSVTFSQLVQIQAGQQRLEAEQESQPPQAAEICEG